MKKVLLTTDLYHPHNDPNDHWNLATMYCLAMKKLIKFVGVLCDEDKPDRVRGFQTYGDPSVQSIAQLNYITGISVPEAVGSHKPMTCEEDIVSVLSSKMVIPSANHIISVLEEGGEVDIHLCGSCRDVLLAYRMRPELFDENVRIFLNAGTYTDQDILEYNVSLEPFSFSQIFKIPCKIMWAPCFESLHDDKFGKLAKHANFYSVKHEDVLPYLSRQMKNFFNYMYSQETETGWLSYIQGEVDEEVFERFKTGDRWMWSTPGFLLSAGMFFDASGNATQKMPQCPLFEYIPVVVDCNTDGRLSWRFAKEDEKTNVSIFSVSDVDDFQRIMAETVKSLLKELP